MRGPEARLRPDDALMVLTAEKQASQCRSKADRAGGWYLGAGKGSSPLERLLEGSPAKWPVRRGVESTFRLDHRALDQSTTQQRTVSLRLAEPRFVSDSLGQRSSEARKWSLTAMIVDETLVGGQYCPIAGRRQ